MVDRVGQQLGSYRLTRFLGRGGFAEVYLGEHVRLNNYAAVKILNTSLADSDAESFQREAHIIARLLHPHIIRVFDYDVAEGTPFLIMDYAPNGTLRNQHPKGTRVPFGNIVSYVKQVASALQYAHNEKVIHRDIKPENMLLGRNNEVLLSDFGIATASQSSRYQQTQDIGGTIAYMAPEQIHGKPHPASDQYSLAIVVYEWLSGERPFHGSFSEIAVQHVLAQPQPLHERVSGIAPQIEQVLGIALAKDPRQRFANVQAFANALEQASTTRSSLVDVPTYSAPSSTDTVVPSAIETVIPNTPIIPVTAVTIPAIPNVSTSTPVFSSPNTPTPVYTPPNTPVVAQKKRILSRRAVMIGSVAVLALAGGSIADLAFSHYFSANAPTPSGSPTPSATSATHVASTPSNSTQAPSTPTSNPTTSLYNGSWSSLASLPSPEADNVAIYVHVQQKDYIYMTGGYRGSNQSPAYDHNLYSYDIAANQWNLVTSNFPGMLNNAVAQDEKQNLFFTVGYSTDSPKGVTSLLYMYQPTTGVLQSLTPSIGANLGFGGSMLADQHGHLYLSQGFLQVGQSSAGTGWYQYDIAQNAWHPLAPLPQGIGYAVLAFDSQGNIVLVGGVSDTEQKNENRAIYRYAITQDSWTMVQTVTPQAFNGAASCALGNGLVVIAGGYDARQQTTLDTAWLLNLNTFQLRPLTPLPAGSRLGSATCDRAGNVYVVRGANDTNAQPTADFWQLHS